ncbi:Coenzyme A disulfide reductase [Porphyromonas macacae]|uniref:Coenzyme A disulfide reductase n=1 Tax=Porphyromonas macacae TaxID=28115 RepID=A0A379DFM4_9PORP|nr:FAD-dependent oxidoreductase [Porphyromonas macacae]SUB77180.1 Coenzyme A disulfide reductase [Porphyromonas macacae]
MKYVIVGGVAGGATAAARLRRIDEKAEIVLFEKGEYISYANCGLPYYIGGVIEDRENLFVQTPASFAELFNFDVRVKSEVTRIDRTNKQVEVLRADGTKYTENYDKLLLSPGALPVVPPLPGVNSPGVFTLRNVADTDAIKSYIDEHNVKHAIVVGGGFIGLEMAENLHEKGIRVDVVEMAPQVMTPIDFSMAAIIHAHMKEKGAGLYLGKAVKSIQEKSGFLSLSLDSGEKLDADLVLLSIGVRPNTELAVNAGLETGEARGIKVNEYLCTSDPDIYAVGDAIEFPHPITGKPWTNYLAGPANRQARIVADNMKYGNRKKYEGAIGTAIAKVFDLTVGATGLSAKALKQNGIPYLTATVQPNSHAGYYPDAYPMTLKIVFDPENGRLYGAQCVGIDGVDKRIDSIAQLIKHNGTVEDLIQTEQAYAPPFSSAKDPVAMAGYVADNILAGRLKPLYWREMQKADPNEVSIIDVRLKQAYDIEHIRGAISIPLEEMRERMKEIPTDKPVYIYCAVGLRGYLASNILRQSGFRDVRNLIGGYRLYSTATADYNTAAQERGKKQSNNHPDTSTVALQVNACGIACPGPILRLKQGIEKIKTGERLRIEATDPGFVRDAGAWCETTGHRLISQDIDKGKYIVTIEKTSCKEDGTCVSKTPGKGKTFILFSDDLDKALATFVLANGAAATGQKVTVFFTFWGLNAIKKMTDRKPKKDIWGKMFGMMLPKDSRKLKLSKMNMGGLGAKMMRMVMKKKQVDSLESMRMQALANGVEFIACQMSMDVMGIGKEELMDEVTIGGVATYMNRAEQANINLFI